MTTVRHRQGRHGAFVGAAIIVGALFLPARASAQAPVPGPCEEGVLASGALSLICVPDAGWNGELVVYAPGYVDPDKPLGFYHLNLPDGTPIPTLVQLLGYAFATTSYRQNGLAIVEGIDDIKELLGAFLENGFAQPLRTHIAGVSEGGLVATLLAEQSPELFSSAFAACAPIGSFRGEVNHIDDFRVLFDYFFPGIIPGSAIDIPPSVIANWDTRFVPAIISALAANPGRALELMRTSKAVYDPAVPATIVNTALDILRYNVMASNDERDKLGGNPFGNRVRWYFGSTDDFRLNVMVERFSADPPALAALRAYETTGELSIPLVTLHTTADDVTPIWHELLYYGKTDLVARGRFAPLPVSRYGHCNVTAQEVLASFLIAVNLP
jgi:pimeloyl-ACP methyl ester carboxylesterase